MTPDQLAAIKARAEHLGRLGAMPPPGPSVADLLADVGMAQQLVTEDVPALLAALDAATRREAEGEWQWGVRWDYDDHYEWDLDEESARRYVATYNRTLVRRRVGPVEPVDASEPAERESAALASETTHHTRSALSVDYRADSGGAGRDGSDTVNEITE